jgi:hypothetical protein
LQVRLETLRTAEAAAAASAPPATTQKAAVVVPAASAKSDEFVAEPAAEPIAGIGLPEPVTGEGWSSDSLNSGAETEGQTEQDLPKHSVEDSEDEEPSGSNS